MIVIEIMMNLMSITEMSITPDGITVVTDAIFLAEGMIDTGEVDANNLKLKTIKLLFIADSELLDFSTDNNISLILEQY
ncbi:MAG: hypothetical protein AAF383_16970 [Cyanobacteria bacterium P01_A01_bin.83]